MTLTKQVEGAVKLIEELRKPPVLLTDERPKVVPISTVSPKIPAKIGKQASVITPSPDG